MMKNTFRLLMATALATTVYAAPFVSGPPGEATAVEAVPPSVEESEVTVAPPTQTPVEVEADRPFAMVGLTWDADDADEAAPVEVRVRTESGAWSEWVTLDVAEDAAEPGSADDRGDRPATEALWVDSADAVEIRAADEDGAGRPRVELIDPGTSPNDAVVASEAVAQAGTAQAAPTQPDIVTRAQWGADESLRNCTPTVATGLKAGIVHHTVGSNTYSREDSAAIVRGIYAFHTQSRGWCDIGYNFLVDRFGTVFEGRTGGITKPVIGAQTGGFNTYTLGVSLMGTFTSVQPPAVMWDSVARLLAWRFAAAGIDPLATTQLTSGGNSKFPAGTTVRVPTIVGHRDLYATECPGNAAYPQLASLRTKVDGLITSTASGGSSPESPSTSTPMPSPPPSSSPPPPGPASGVSQDFNGDGRADVLARDGAGALWLYPGNGSGGWLARSQVGSGWNVMTPVGSTTTAPPAGSVQDVAGGRVYTSSVTGSHAVVAGMQATYRALGETASALGWPTSDEYAVPGGAAQDFTGGRLVFSAATQEVTNEKPRATRSRYMVLSTNAASDRANAKALGCEHAKAGRPGLYLLAYGTQEPSGLRPPGTSRSSQWPRASYGLVTDTAKAYVEGVIECRPSRALTYQIGLGVNNKSDGGVPGSEAGSRWASVVDEVSSWVETLGEQAFAVSVVGANDMEPGWGPSSWARAWVDAYLGATPRPLVSFGSADGCPTYGSSSVICNNSWTVGDVWYVSGGASTRVSVLPQIYRTDGIQASQWARISSWGAQQHSRPLTFAGALSQAAACRQRSGCTNTANAPETAWTQLWNALRAHPETRLSVLPSSTDMEWAS